jgi:hypothetical protein
MSPQPSSSPERQTNKVLHGFACNECISSIVGVAINALHQSVQLTSRFSQRITSTHFNPKNRPFLTRLVGDPFGKEAVWETNIGDTKHVIKHINQHGSLAGWSIPILK